MPISITSAPAPGSAVMIASDVSWSGIAGHDESDKGRPPFVLQGRETAVDAGRQSWAVG